jgi:REP element-mobilizing transposase RayT
VHVTIRVVAGLPSLRHRAIRRIIFRSIDKGSERFGFRLVHFSVQSNHLHLVCEADDQRALSRGMQGLSVRLARRLNKQMGRSGKLFKERYHARVLRSPREVRNALRYALLNARRHGVVAPRRWLDPCSSGILFDGWNTGVFHSTEGGRELVPEHGKPITAAPQSWMLRSGWLARHGPLDPGEVPGAFAPAAKTRRKKSRAPGTETTR